MSTYAQRAFYGPVFSGGVLQGACKMYHYEAGTSTLKNIWSDRSKVTSLAQPFVADANGVFNFFADGIYKLIIVGPDSTGPSDDVLYTLDNWQFLDPSDPTFSEGTAIPSSSTLAVGPEIWAHVTGSTDIDELDGTIPFFWAVFDGNLTLNYSASLLTPASIDLAVRTGDVCLFLNEGSDVWRVAAHYQSDGLVIATQDSRTNTVDVPLTVRSTTSGTPAAGIGTGILLQAESADEAPCNLVQLEGQLSDVASGTEDSTFRVLLRTAGAALSIAWEWARASGAFVGIFTHANTANRIYTLPDFDGTLATLAGTETPTNKTFNSATNTFNINSGGGVKTGGLATATGSSTVNGGLGDTTVTMNDYSFFPNITSQLSSPTGVAPISTADTASSDTVGRLGINTSGSASGSAVIYWRYITASDDPTIWVAYDPATGNIVATWASDDPTPGDVPGVVVPGMTSVRLKAQQLEHLSALSARAREAGDMIRAKRLRMQHQAYRALQLHANDDAPSRWLMDHCEMGSNGLLRMRTPDAPRTR